MIKIKVSAMTILSARPSFNLRSLCRNGYS